MTTLHDPIRVAALDDHPVILRGLRALAGEHPDKVVLTRAAARVKELMADGLDADVVLLDLRVPDHPHPEETVRTLTRRGIKVVLHTAQVQPVPIRVAMAAGAVGLVLKSDDEDAVLEAIELAAAGEYAVTGELAYLLANDPKLVADLAPREVEVLRLLAQGVPKKAIGRHMTGKVITLATVNTYFSRIARKYAALHRPVGDALGAVREAQRDGHLDLAADEEDWIRRLN
ncbi:response regulator [Enemella dayhoffiae]|uniref:response regulator n=1 Tax=Enemella dayhoffiae TaxID=2016507 RepID=UPI001595E4BD|nr:response regulator transcription factor [Enemella dayhoffiae]